ncbi:MAG: lipoprotein [Treponema sp.]|nr:lipoprotein [Treponema sp.]
MKKYIYIILTVLLLTSCATNSTTFKGGVMTSCMPSGNLKYYIRPTKMNSIEKNDKSYALIDFTYQKVNRDYVTSSFTNFTIYYQTTAFIKNASFLLHDEQIITLSNIKTIDRDTKKGFIRVSSILENQSLEKTLYALHSSNAKLKVEFDSGDTKFFIPSKDMINKISEAFSK